MRTPQHASLSPMINDSAAIFPGKGLGGLRLHDKLDLADWNSADDYPILWEIGCADLRAFVNYEGTVIAFVDNSDEIRGLYATPRYRGTLFDSLYTGMTGLEAVAARPSLYFWSCYASLRDKECEGFYLTVEEIDLDEDVFLKMPMLFIGVFDESEPYFM